jgi:hypothetical protein
MPQATRELQIRWNHDQVMDSDATNHLLNSGNFYFSKGIIKAIPGYQPTPDDYSAIDYLCQEWDYGWEPQQLT